MQFEKEAPSPSLKLSLTLSISSDSKQMRIHSRAGTYSAPLSAIRPTRSMQFSCT